MKSNYKFYQNKECEWFPCHSIHDTENFSCQFCYCPLLPYEDCGGNYAILVNGWKDCSNCIMPHYNYDYVVEKIMELHK